MAFYSVLRRASSSVLPLAIRSVGSSKTFNCAMSAVLTSGKAIVGGEVFRRSSVQFMRFSTDVAVKRSADENLIRVLESEIECAQEDGNLETEVPDSFPFNIEDNIGERTILLTREYQDDTVKVEVDIPNIDVEDEDDDADNDEKRSDDSSIPMVVRITKGKGQFLEFGVSSFSNELTIDSLSIKQAEGSENELAYEGPDFNDLDENLQKALHQYLEVRGIKPTTANFLIEYMINKDNKEYFHWLKNFKDFIDH